MRLPLNIENGNNTVRARFIIRERPVFKGETTERVHYTPLGKQEMLKTFVALQAIASPSSARNLLQVG